MEVTEFVCPYQVGVAGKYAEIRENLFIYEYKTGRSGGERCAKIIDLWNLPRCLGKCQLLNRIESIRQELNMLAIPPTRTDLLSALIGCFHYMYSKSGD